MTQNDLFDDIIGVLDETYNSYQNSKLENNTDMKSEDYYANSDRDRIYKNEDRFAEPQKINSALFHQNEKSSSNLSFKIILLILMQITMTQIKINIWIIKIFL